MWIVKLAVRRPYTFAVMAIAILIAGFASFRQTPKDIFPEIDIPVISVIWTYNGLSAEEFEKQITVYSEFALSANVMAHQVAEYRAAGMDEVVGKPFEAEALWTAMAELTAEPEPARAAAG